MSSILELETDRDYSESDFPFENGEDFDEVLTPKMSEGGCST